MVSTAMHLNRTLPPDASTRALVHAAEQLVEQGRLEEALAAYQQIFSAGGASTRTMLRIGDLYRKLGRHAEAVEAYSHVALRYQHDGADDKAIAVYRHIRAIVGERPDELALEHAASIMKLGELCSHLGRTLEALASYDDVATWLIALGRERDALLVLEKMLALSDHPSTRLRMADCHARLGDDERAVSCSGDAAVQLVERGRLDEALTVLARMLATWPDPSFARMAARLHLERGGEGDAVEALTKLQLCVRAWPEDIATLELLARAFDAVGERAKARKVLDEAARIATQHGDASSAARIVAARREREPSVESVQLLGLEGEIDNALRRCDGTPAEPGPAALDEDALWLAEELASAGRFELARTLVKGELMVRPDHPLVKRVAAQVEALAKSFPSSPPPSLASALEGRSSYPPPPRSGVPPHFGGVPPDEE
jgi:tetratricopeptide (TPR) repeat protein